MTSCKYDINRVVPIKFKSRVDLTSIPTDSFCLFLIQGSVNLIINGEKCNIGGKALLCLDKTAKLTVLASHQLKASLLFFSPSFINVNLNWDIINLQEYASKCAKHNYPQFELFLHKNAVYNGILPLTDDLYLYIETYFFQIGKQLDEQPDANWSCRTRGFILRMINTLRTFIPKNEQQGNSKTLSSQVCDYLLVHLNEEISIKKLCEEFSTNHTTLTKKFREYTGFTISNFINLKRLDNAKYLLAFTSLSIEEISKQNGFNELSYFSKLFKQNMSITPLKYRESMRNNRPNINHIIK